MTARTDKDVTGDAADAVVDEPAAEEPEDGPAASGAAARPAKRKRRVRVIEVLDGEDIDEVLDAIDAEEEAGAAEPAAETAATAKPAARPVKPVVERIEPPATVVDEPAAKPSKPSKPSGPDAGRRAFLGLGREQAVVVVVLVAVLASLAVWQWRSASGEASKADERAAVGKVAAAYGDVALNYNASNYQAQMAKAQKLMGGDLLESFKATTLPSLGDTFKSSPELALSSKTSQTFVGSVDGRFATAVVMVDIKVQSKEATEAPATLLRLALAKIDGDWKVTKQYASGVNDQNQNQQAGGSQLPVPSDGAPSGGQPKDGKTGKPKN
ncbi:hypothetical protein [Spirillospora sp. NBC_01491]|uniref:hypothetical protein n=1 Tax=Spirillospora sp. NBC_01491 TaxID=2976007 RepID=UPI002E376C8B|nr:hypothetical protein [Spirillospora sp. NBC_01491]